MRPACLFVLLALAITATFGCGPSLRRVHLADVYFERCYAGERDPQYDDAARRRCWDGWLTHYTTGASDERVSYARERMLMLDPEQGSMMELATGEMGLELAVAEGSDAVEDVPVVALTAVATGTDLEVSPSPPVEETPELVARHRPSLPRSVSAHCEETCLPPWDACVDACENRDAGCNEACRTRFRVCAGACY